MTRTTFTRRGRLVAVWRDDRGRFVSRRTVAAERQRLRVLVRAAGVLERRRSRELLRRIHADGPRPYPLTLHTPGARRRLAEARTWGF